MTLLYKEDDICFLNEYPSMDFSFLQQQYSIFKMKEDLSKNKERYSNVSLNWIYLELNKEKYLFKVLSKKWKSDVDYVKAFTQLGFNIYYLYLDIENDNNLYIIDALVFFKTKLKSKEFYENLVKIDDFFYPSIRKHNRNKIKNHNSNLKEIRDMTSFFHKQNKTKEIYYLYFIFNELKEFDLEISNFNLFMYKEKIFPYIPIQKTISNRGYYSVEVKYLTSIILLNQMNLNSYVLIKDQNTLNVFSYSLPKNISIEKRLFIESEQTKKILL